ncbi:hypothetical protein LTR17_018257 [Elasticomyces elasticus]|nr:hypothetical protein LTR17_018257 [Elasticomyces elasticus]
MTVFEAGGLTPTGYLDDEITAWTAQLEEINEREDSKKGKYSLSSIPHLEVAYTVFLSEIHDHLQVLSDARLAHRFASAIDLDGEVLTELSQLEAQAREDRRIAVQMSCVDPELETPPPYTDQVREGFIKDEHTRWLDPLVSSPDDTHHEAVIAGPSERFAHHRANTVGKLASVAFQCAACTETFGWADLTQLQCEHAYCGTCLKAFMLRGVKEHDLALFPPRCCGKPLPHAIIANSLSDKEMEDFQGAQVERDTKDKTYCSNAECGQFIDSRHITAANATCPRCESHTCVMCKSSFHENDCPADPDFRAVLELGSENEWQRCFSCRSLVAIQWGCNHMT